MLCKLTSVMESPIVGTFMVCFSQRGAVTVTKDRLLHSTRSDDVDDGINVAVRIAEDDDDDVRLHSVFRTALLAMAVVVPLVRDSIFSKEMSLNDSHTTAMRCNPFLRRWNGRG